MCGLTILAIVAIFIIASWLDLREENRDRAKFIQEHLREKEPIK